MPEDGRFMGRGLDFCLDYFDYTEYSKEEIMEKCRIEPRVLEETDAFRRVPAGGRDADLLLLCGKTGGERAGTGGA